MSAADLSGIATTPIAWDADVKTAGDVPGHDRILFTRSIARRNFAGLPFWVSASPETCAAIAERAREHAAREGFRAGFTLADAGPDAVGLFREREWLPERPAAFPGKRGFKTLFLDADANEHALLGETEHWTRFRVLPGLPENFEPGFGGTETASGPSSIVGEGIFARSPAFGFLTSNPSFAGTGLQFETGLHLPALAASGNIASLQRAMSAMGLELQPLSLRVPGLAEAGFFRLLSRGGMDLSSESLYRRFADKVPALLAAETEALEQWQAKESHKLEDRIHRSLRLLQEARVLGYGEFLKFASFARIGAYSGRFPAALPRSLETLRVRAQPFHLLASHPGSTPEEGDRLRAAQVRAALADRVPAA